MGIRKSCCRIVRVLPAPWTLVASSKMCRTGSGDSAITLLQKFADRRIGAQDGAVGPEARGEGLAGADGDHIGPFLHITLAILVKAGGADPSVGAQTHSVIASGGDGGNIRPSLDITAAALFKFAPLSEADRSDGAVLTQADGVLVAQRDGFDPGPVLDLTHTVGGGTDGTEGAILTEGYDMVGSGSNVGDAGPGRQTDTGGFDGAVAAAGHQEIAAHGNGGDILPVAELAAQKPAAAGDPQGTVFAQANSVKLVRGDGFDIFPVLNVALAVFVVANGLHRAVGTQNHGVVCTANDLESVGGTGGDLGNGR